MSKESPHRKIVPENMFTNEMGPTLSVDERTKFVNQFDMVKFEDRVR